MNGSYEYSRIWCNCRLEWALSNREEMHSIQINFTLANWYCERTTTNYLHLTSLTLHLLVSPTCQCETHVLSCQTSSIPPEEGTVSVSLISTYWEKKKKVNFSIKTKKARTLEGTTKLILELSHDNKIMALHEFHLMQHKEINRKK